MAEYETAIFAALLTKAEADTGAGGLFETSGTNRLIGGFILSSWREKERHVPRIEVDPPESGRIDSHDTENTEAVWRFHVICQRNRAYGTGDTPQTSGQMDGIVGRVEAVFDAATISPSGWTSGVVSCDRHYRGPETPEYAHRIVEMVIRASRS